MCKTNLTRALFACSVNVAKMSAIKGLVRNANAKLASYIHEKQGQSISTNEMKAAIKGVVSGLNEIITLKTT